MHNGVPAVPAQGVDLECLAFEAAAAADDLKQQRVLAAFYALVTGCRADHKLTGHRHAVVQRNEVARNEILVGSFRVEIARSLNP